MKSRFISDLQDAWDASLPSDTAPILANFFPASSFSSFHPATNNGGEGSFAHSTPHIPLTPTLPDESVEAQAAVAQSGSGGPGSVVAVAASSGFTINLIFDAAAMAAPAGFRTAIQQAASILSATISNKITVNLNIDYSGTGGGAAAGPDNGLFESYSTVKTDLIKNAAPGDTVFNSLPTGTTISGQSSAGQLSQAQSQVAVWNAQLKLFGLLSPNDTTTDDGSATFATDISPSLLVGVALHELTHAIGRVPFGANSNSFEPDIFDFYRFTSAGTRLFTDSIPASASYFSLDGGNTKLADFGVSSDTSDFLNPPGSNLTPNDAFDEFYSSNTLQSLTAVDKEILDALGFNTTPQGIVVTTTATEAMQGGAAVTLLSGPPNINDPSGTTLSSATIRIADSGNNAVAGDKLFVNGVQNGPLGNGVTASWNASAGTLTLSGSASIAVYATLLSEVSYQDTGSDASSGSHPVRIVTWTVSDGTNSFNTTSQITVDRLPVANSDAAADTVGSTVTLTAASGVLANDSDLDGDKLTVTGISDVAKGAGSVGSSLAGVYGHLTLNADGSYSYVADNLSAINSGPTGSHLKDIFTYTVSDGNGGTASASLTISPDRPPVVTAANVTLGVGQASVAASSLFSSTDPDGDSIATYAFKDTGGGHFVLNGVAQANNQEIDVTAAQLSLLTYQSVPGSSSVDTVQVRVNDGTLWSNWTSFTVTDPLVIEAFGSTSLVEIGNNYFFNSATGPELKYNGAPVVVGQFAPYVPVGVEQTAGGYEVALENAGANLFSIWNTDSSGNFVSYSVYSGNSTTLESLEASFQQDLNHDGVIGVNVPTTVIESFGSTSLLEIGNNYFFNSATGPELKYNGAPVVAGQFAPYVPVGVEQTTTGYEVALENASANLFSIWNTDSSGNFLSYAVYSGNSTALETLETSFKQDLNGDGVVGVPPPPPPIVIEASGSTSLVQVGNNYFFDPVAGGTGPELKYNGSPVVVGEFSPYTPVGVEQASGGYEVALKNAGTGQFSIWNTDSNGNFLSFTVYAGTSTALETLETSFNQDLNGDGVIGVPPPPPPIVIEASGSTSLVQVGNNYFFDPVAGGTGPELKYNGSPVVVGEFSPYTPVGVEQTSGGYEVAFKDASTGQFSIWNTDSNGNFFSFAVYSGTSTALETLETSFHQDLNGDGVIGVPAATAPVTIASNDSFAFSPNLGANAISNAGRLDSIELNEFSSIAGQKLASLVRDAQTAEVRSLFGNDAVIDPGNHDSINSMNAHTFSSLHANDFIVR
jgi:VCBS repeat-containing protein